MSTLSARARSRLNSMSICGESCEDELLTLAVPGVSVERLRDCGRVRVGLAARRRDGHVDRLRVAAARAGRRNRDDLRVGHELVADDGHLPRDLIGRVFAIVAQDDAQLAGRAEVDAAAEAGLDVPEVEVIVCTSSICR
jgi:hypothetical protein